MSDNPVNVRSTPFSVFLFVLTHTMLSSLSAQAQATNTPENAGTWDIRPHGRFEIRGQYGAIPVQIVPVESDYTWWVPGHVGFWASRIEAGLEVANRKGLTFRLTLSTRSDRSDRDFTVWGDEVRIAARLKEASVRLDRLGLENLSLIAGRQTVDYPLLTDYDYVGGRLLYRMTPWLTFDWGQWQVFEGDIIDLPGQSSDDIDLYGPQIRMNTPKWRATLYGLIHSRAGGRDGVGQNVRIIGVSGVRSEGYLKDSAGSAAIQWGETSAPIVGARSARAWAVHGRLRLRPAVWLLLGADAWAGSGDDASTPKTDEGYASLGYRNTLEKFTAFYRPGMNGLRLVSVLIEAGFPHLTGRIEAARIDRASSPVTAGEEISLTLEYPYSDRVALRWRWATTRGGDRMQGFELSSAFGD
jgi:hypothetical protein